eukprot:9171219-Pyramimonas_sp.AAC.1
MCRRAWGPTAWELDQKMPLRAVRRRGPSISTARNDTIDVRLTEAVPPLMRLGPAPSRLVPATPAPARVPGAPPTGWSVPAWRGIRKP